MAITEAIDKAQVALDIGWDENFPIDPVVVASEIMMVSRDNGEEIPIIMEGEPLSQESGYAEFVEDLIFGDHFRCVYNIHESNTRQRFTQAHELGHVMLGHVYEGSSPRRDARFDGSTDYKERDANIFSAELLMPEKYVRHQASRITDISKLASFFGVSPWAIRIRLERLGIL